MRAGATSETVHRWRHLHEITPLAGGNSDPPRVATARRECQQKRAASEITHFLRKILKISDQNLVRSRCGSAPRGVVDSRKSFDSRRIVVRESLVVRVAGVLEIPLLDRVRVVVLLLVLIRCENVLGLVLVAVIVLAEEDTRHGVYLAGVHVSFPQIL